LHAMEQIRRMRGGAQSHLMRCSDGRDHDLYYVVKFQNNPQHSRVLVNELLGTRLAARMGLPVPPVAVVDVGPDLIRVTPALCIELPRSRTPCRAGLQFGSSYPGNPRSLTLYDFLPDEQLRQVQNLYDFAGMLVFDKWTCNTNGRQTLFFRDGGRARSDTYTPGASQPTEAPNAAGGSYRTVMIDQGFCFNAGEWNFPDAPLRGLYARRRVYENVRGIEAFEPWIARIETKMTEAVLAEIAGEIPPEWYGSEMKALERMLEQLARRRKRVGDLIMSAWKSSVEPFPNWK
jgi:hypothetical protein